MPGSPPPSLRPDSPLVDAARLLLEELDLLFLAQRKNQARIAHALARAKRLELHKACGYTSLSALAWDRYDCGRSKTTELIAIVEACERLPRIRAAFDAGALHWTKAREITKVATPQTERDWLRRAATSSVQELRAARQGADPKVQRVLSFTPEQAARFDQALAGVRDGLDLAEAGLAVLAVLEGGGGALGESATARVVISECGTCRAATTESQEGPVPMEPAAVEAARCAGEVHDLRQSENVVTRAIPAKVRRRVLDRDRRRCQAPRCRNLSFLEVHHEGGWRAGHEPSRMLVLCEAHHRQRHEGWLLIEGQAPDFRFRTRIGVALDADAEAFAHENTRGPEPSPKSTSRRAEVFAHENTRGPERSELEVAGLFLGRLGMQAAERRRRLEEVVRRAGPRGWSAEELVRAVLVAA